MPRYYKLRKWPRDSTKRREEKERIANKLLNLRKSLRLHIRNLREADINKESLDSDRFIRLATWNIRELGANKKFGKRIDESLFYIAEILSHFDLIAVQEVNRDLGDFKKIMSNLGGNWDYLATDVTEGTSGNQERMAFVFNKNKVWFRDIAGEVVLKEKDEIKYPFEERLKFGTGFNIQLPTGAKLQSPSNVKTYRRMNIDRLSDEVEITLPEDSWLQIPEL